MLESMIQWISLAGMAVVGAAFIAEVRKWRALEGVIGRRQRMLRIGLAVLIEALFVMMFLGPWVSIRIDTLGKLLYWSVCLIIGMAVVVLALLDLSEVAKGLRALNRRIREELMDAQRQDRK
ncbi:MAG: hypothetical protein M1133_05570 [Armatimonadetes bacterium]|nr:hypothetical protein [Armatimonadota bacterium]